MSWVPLHVHSQYSILDATASLKAIAERATKYQMPAVALTDQGNLHGAVDFFKECKAAKVKAIIGCELYVAPGSRLEKKKVGQQKAGYPIVLLAKNREGYKNLCKLSSAAHLEGFYYTPRIDKELLTQLHEGLICLSGGYSSRIGELILNGGEVQEEIGFYHDLFKEDFYLEFTRHAMSEEQMRADGMDKESWLWQAALDFQEKEKRLFEGLRAVGLQGVATNNSRYIEREDWRAQEILMNVSSGEPCEIWEKDSQGNLKARILNPKRRVLFSHELYFKSPEEMERVFADYPEAVAESVKIAEKCAFEFDFNSKFYPVFVPPELEGKSYTGKEREQAAAQFLRDLCEKRIQERYAQEALAKVGEQYPDKDAGQVVRDRLKYELDLIISKGLCDYLLIVYDFIAWAKGQKIPVGPGRGSGAGSIVCFLTGITDIEPLRFNLFFERFINPERVSYPDIDVDICMDRRSEVIDYTVRKYGKDNVAQIITFGTMKAKMAIKDVGRVLSIPLSKVNEIAKLIPEDPTMTIDRALELDPDLAKAYEADPETKRLIDLAKTLEGCVRNTGIHAAGLIVSGEPLVEHIPVCYAKDAQMVVTQYAMKPVEAVGMLKIDFLGLKTLTAIQLAVDSIEQSTGTKIPWVNLPLDDQITFALLNQGKTLGIFQLESGGMQDLAKQLHIDKFEEIIAVGALYRPGPMEMIPSFISRKHGKENIEFDHPMMRDILQETYGIMVYQEQVMMMAQRLAGYSLGAGDVLRKAMGKKDKEEMGRQREKFRAGAVKNGIEERVALEIFDKIEKFASYGFNKSHAAAYGYLSYVTAYLKSNYPSHWMAALMTTDRDDLSRVTKIIRESQSMHIPILAPDVNESSIYFTPTSKGIRFALTAIKGVGEGVVGSIINERKTNGAFKSLYDFIHRLDTQKVGKKVVESLVEAGAFDFTSWSRAALLQSIEPLYTSAQKEQKEKARGELNFFSMLEEEPSSYEKPTETMALTKMEILRKEKQLLGFYLTGHPLDESQELLKQLSCVSLDRVEQMEVGAVFRSGCIIESVITKITKAGKKFAILTISDGHQHFELPIWADIYEDKSYLLVENQLVYLVLQLEKDEDGQIRLQCRFVDDLTKVDETMIQECDRAFDKARMQVKLGQIRMRDKKPQKKVEKEEMKKIIFKMDAERTRLSHVLHLKNLFSMHRGKTSIQLEFWTGEHHHGKVFIDSAWGIEVTEQLLSKIREETPIVKIDTSS